MKQMTSPRAPALSNFHCPYGCRHHGIIPPIGVFWDIENCQVPKNKSAIDLVQRIRDKFFDGHREAEFMCVCDINKESKHIIEELNCAQVNVIHVNATSKNAADDKLRQCLRRFGSANPPPATVVLLSGDVNFATELSDLRHRHNFRIIIVHGGSVANALLSFSHEHFSFDDLLADLPCKASPTKSDDQVELLVSNLPTEVPNSTLKNKLKQLSDNCGGKVRAVRGCHALLRFSTPNGTRRAQKRMDGESICGTQIKVEFPRGSEEQENKQPKDQSKNATAPGPLLIKAIHSDGSNRGSPSASSPLSKIPKKITVNLPENNAKTTIHKTSNLSGSQQRNTKSETNMNVQSLLNKLSDACDRNITATGKGFLSIQQQRYQEKQEQKYNEHGTQHIQYSTLTKKTRNNYDNNSDSGSSKNSYKPLRRDEIQKKHVRPLLSPSANLNGYTVYPGPAPDLAYLMVSNLDFNISAKEWRKIIYSTFQQNVAVLGVDVRSQNDGSNVAIVTVPTEEEARYTISQFHRMKIGYKRISVTLMNDDSRFNNLRAEAYALLKDITGHKLPVYKFKELYEKRYNKNLSSSDMYKLHDICEFNDLDSGNPCPSRYIQLRDSANGSMAGDGSEAQIEEIISETAYCQIHCPLDSTAYLEASQLTVLPNVKIQLKFLAMQVHTMLQSHTGDMPLHSFLSCYEAEFYDKLDIPIDGGVPLEHLLSCIPGVQVAMSRTGIKKIQWAKNRTDESIKPIVNPNLTQFGREVVDLLKQQPQCRLHSSRFIPTYHHHFGRQCRVADYGYTKLSELLDAIPHVLQVMGSRSVLTLTHRCQVRRFISDLTRLLRAQPEKQIMLNDIADAFNKLTGKTWDVCDYGVCYIEDMLGEVPDTTVTIFNVGPDLAVMLPRRDQTPEEVEHTKQFGLEAVELLKHSPQCRIPFNKFIPAYHHHFGKQCRVADYGFMKLIELFEALPDVLKVVEDEDDKIIGLTEDELIKVLENQVSFLLKTSPGSQILLGQFMSSFLHYHGHALCLSDYHADSVPSLIDKIPRVAKVMTIGGHQYVRIVERSALSKRAKLIFMRLMDSSRGAASVLDMSAYYFRECHETARFTNVVEELQDLIEVIGAENSKIIKLSALHMFARELRLLLQKNQGRLGLPNLESSYFHNFGVELKPVQYGFATLLGVLQAIPYMASVRGKGFRKTILLHQDFLNRITLPVVKKKLTVIQPLMSIKLPNSIHTTAERNTPSTDSAISGITDSDNHKEDLMHSTTLLNSRKISEENRTVVHDLDLQVGPPDDLIRSLNQTQKTKYNFNKPSLVDELIDLSHTEKQGHQRAAAVCRTPVSQLLQKAAQYLPAKSTEVAIKTQEESKLVDTMAWVYSHHSSSSAASRIGLLNSNGNNCHSDESNLFDKAAHLLPVVSKCHSSFATPLKAKVQKTTDILTPPMTFPASKKEASPATALIMSLAESVLLSPTGESNTTPTTTTDGNTAYQNSSTSEYKTPPSSLQTTPVSNPMIAPSRSSFSKSSSSSPVSPSPRKCRIAARFNLSVESSPRDS